MDVGTIIAAVASSLGLGVPAAAWLSQALVGHRLEKDMATFRAALEADRARNQAWLEAEIKQRVETILADEAAERQYELEAKRRLYTAIGPLRFQLVLACPELAGRIEARGSVRGEQYSTSLDGYYGRSTLYRILRPLCLAELIETQIAFADFSVDPAALDLLRFKKGAFSALSGDVLVAGHPRVDWTRQAEHVFVDNISKSANALIVATDEQRRAMRFHEFEAFLATDAGFRAITPFPDLLEHLSPAARPLLAEAGRLRHALQRLHQPRRRAHRLRTPDLSDSRSAGCNCRLGDRTESRPLTSRGARTWPASASDAASPS
jgi:hypothetical protein